MVAGSIATPRRMRCVVVAAAVAAGLAPSPATAAEEKGKAAARAPVVDPRADALLRAMSDTLASAEHFSYQAKIEFDDVLPTGQKIQYAAVQDVAVRRPDRVYVEYDGDLGANRAWYDGKKLTLIDDDKNVYGAVPMPGRIDAALERLIETYGFSPPLSDFLHADPYKVLRQRVQFGIYVGKSYVEGVRCHHLAFVEKTIDWQIWIEDGTQLVPHKLVISYPEMPGSPEFEAVLSHWNFDSRLTDFVFEPMIPEGATEIDFVSMAGEAKERR